jgi:hypothetical protein
MRQRTSQDAFPARTLLEVHMVVRMIMHTRVRMRWLRLDFDVSAVTMRPFAELPYVRVPVTRAMESAQDCIRGKANDDSYHNLCDHYGYERTHRFLMRQEYRDKLI